MQLVNAVAPFILNARLKPLMRARPGAKHIVNVSAMEGQFYRAMKTDKHPHTNMAKAALNMMTRTCAPDYAQDGIYMNAVDTGWVTDETLRCTRAQGRRGLLAAARRDRRRGAHRRPDLRRARLTGRARLRAVLEGLQAGALVNRQVRQACPELGRWHPV